MTQTITRLYGSYDTALQAALALKEAGFAERELSLVASRAAGHSPDQFGAETEDAATGAMFGGAIGAASGLLAGVGFLAIPGLGPVVAAGWLASTLAVGAAGAVAGGVTGGIVGALAGAGTAEEEARAHAEGIRRGDSLVSVQVPDDRVLEATRILSAYPTVDLAAREAEDQGAGWHLLDAAARSRLAQRQKPVLPAGLPTTRPE